MKIFVARISNNIQADIQREWSAWQTPGLGGSREDCLQDIADGYANGEIREFPEHPGSFGIVHHAGISSYLLVSETEQEAIEESQKTRGLDGTGYGVAAHGCRLVKSIGNLHILECEEVDEEL